jgi:hypothetical protein
VESGEENDEGDGEFEQARFPIELNLPAGSDQNFEDARKAIRREYKDSSKWKQLLCRRVRKVSKCEAGTIYELEIGHAIEFDWSWEGAIAFRPLQPKEFEEHPTDINLPDELDPDIDNSIVWSGEILEVDEASGRIFIVVSNPQYAPWCGSFYVRPFEFLHFLDKIYNEPAFDFLSDDLSARLSVTTGGIHPQVAEPADFGLEQLRLWWKHSWSILWGPPGTGKTYTTGQQVARILENPTERILVVSTTNRATDAAALSIGKAAKNIVFASPPGYIRRIGKGASFQKYQSDNLTDLLQCTETEYLAQIETLATKLAKLQDPEAKANVRLKIKQIRAAMMDAAKRNFLDIRVQVIISTAFKASTFLTHPEVIEGLAEGFAPFTTIFIDEAGLMSRVAIATLSLLASRRIVLVGDSKQLAPISRISRILEPSQGNWLARSGLSHLDNIDAPVAGVHVLQQQRRMHADICNVVSHFQYEGFLKTAEEVLRRQHTLPKILQEQPRAIWYVLDEDAENLPSIRAERGAGNRSWIRKATYRVLEKLFTDQTLRAANGLFISPFKAQAKDIHSFFVKHNMPSWMASTVHSQQGSEADIVIFDSVNAGSYSWPYDEWKRLVNVALSRSREAVIVLASRSEMEEPYLAPLLHKIAPRVVRKHNNQLSWEEVPSQADYHTTISTDTEFSHLLGYQLTKRKELRLILSNEQQRLCGLELDGKPRLVRGVAGSGKTVILAHWLIQTLQRLADQPSVRIWTVIANRSLLSMIQKTIAAVWKDTMPGQPFPSERVSVYHIRDILQLLLGEVELSLAQYQFDYDEASKAYLERIAGKRINPRCDALFIDEAQDMGSNTMKLLSSLVRCVNESDENSRSIHIFYDNAQNIYGRSTPQWSRMGLDMRGRSTVLEESFRSTRPCTELALNVLYQFMPPDRNPDHKELVRRGLIENSMRNGKPWWTIRFNQIEGPKPTFRIYDSQQQEFEAIGDYCRELIEVQRVEPSDICLIYNGKDIPQRLQQWIAPRLKGLGVELSIQTNQTFQRHKGMLLATTAHSFKGYDSEVVIIPAVEEYRAHGKGVLASPLYVAMTRARSILNLFSHKMNSHEAQRIQGVLDDCLVNLQEAPQVETTRSAQDDIAEILCLIGETHRRWLEDLWKRVMILQEPLITERGELIAEPLFHFEVDNRIYACFGTELPSERVLQQLKELGVKVIAAGEGTWGEA